MNRIIITLTTLLMCLTAWAQSLEPDTVKVIEISDKVIITRNGNNTLITTETVTDRDTATFEYNVTVSNSPALDSLDIDRLENNLFAGLPFENLKQKKHPAKHYKKHYFTGLRNVYFGWNFGYDGNAGIKNCFEAGVANIVGPAWRPFGSRVELSTGIGFGAKRFLTDNGLTFTKSGDRLCLTPVDENTKVKSAHWDIFNADIPLTICLETGRRNNFTLGLSLLTNLNFYSRVTTELEVDGVTSKEKIKGLQQQLITPDIIAFAGMTNGFGLYVKWSPVPVMDKKYGPEFKTWSIGLSLNF